MAAERPLLVPLPIEDELEQIAVGLLIRDPEIDRDVSGECFATPAAIAAYRAVEVLKGRGERVEAFTVARAIAGDGVESRWVLRAVAAADTAAWDAVARPLWDLALRRRCWRVGEQCLRAARTPGAAIEELRGYADELLREGTATTALDGLAVADAVAADMVRPGPVAGELAPVRTHFAPWDAATAGIARGQLALVAARTAIGKSALVQAVAQEVARAGDWVLLVSPEMAAREVIARLLAQRLGLSTSALLRRDLSPPALAEAVAVARGIPARLLLWDASAPTVADVQRIVAQLVARGTAPALVVVDHLGWLGERPEKWETHAQLCGRQARGLRGIARRYGCALVLVCQLNRGSESGEGMRRPVLSDLRSSGELEQDADTVILLHREDREHEDGEFLVAKHRNGPCATIPVRFRRAYCRWETRA